MTEYSGTLDYKCVRSILQLNSLVAKSTGIIVPAVFPVGGLNDALQPHATTPSNFPFLCFLLIQSIALSFVKLIITHSSGMYLVSFIST